MWEELNPLDTQGHSSYSSRAACVVFMTLVTLSIGREIRIQLQTKTREATLDKAIDFSARFGAQKGGEEIVEDHYRRSIRWGGLPIPR
jgi:hypothetical protein